METQPSKSQLQGFKARDLSSVIVGSALWVRCQKKITLEMLLERHEINQAGAGEPKCPKCFPACSYSPTPGRRRRSGAALPGTPSSPPGLPAAHCGEHTHPSPTSGRDQLEHQVCAVVSVVSASSHACSGRLASGQCVASYFNFASRLPVFLEVISALLSEASGSPGPLFTLV